MHRRTRSGNPLLVSQRSNNLQFTISLPSPAPSQARCPHYAAVRGPARPVQEPAEHSGQRKILSLITPYIGLPRRGQGRKAPSIRSVRSTTGSIRSIARVNCESAKLQTLPAELLLLIFSYLSQEALLSLMKTSTHLMSVAVEHLYREPSFASTYRFAQFVHTLVHDPDLGKLVRVVNLRELAKCAGEDEPVAGWREFKYRSNLLHTTYPSMTPREGGQHALPSRFLQQYSLSRDVPTGALIHILTTCPNIRILDLSDTKLAPDYRVVSNSYARLRAGLLFVSDVPKSYTWDEHEYTRVKEDLDLVDAIVGLKKLLVLRTKGGLWLTRRAALRITRDCEGLKYVDFRGCGSQRQTRWAVASEAEKVTQMLEADMRQNT